MHYPTPKTTETDQNAIEIRVFKGISGSPEAQIWLLTTRSAVRVRAGELKHTHSNGALVRKHLDCLEYLKTVLKELDKQVSEIAVQER